MMKNIVFAAIVIFIMVSSLILASCGSTSTTSQSTTTSSNATTITSSIQSTKTSSTTASNTSAPPQTSVTTSATQNNWWDKLGKPQYGGTINVPFASLRGTSWDVLGMPGGNFDMYYDALFGNSWTVSRDEWSFETNFTPEQYLVGNLVDTWEWPNPATIRLHLHQGVKFQNKPPVNGRELTSADVEAHYYRILGTGGGYTRPAPMFLSMVTNFDSVTAVDKYTVEVKFKTPAASNFLSLAERTNMNNIEAPEWVALAGPPGSPTPTPNPLADWKTVVGTGPWLLTDFVAGAEIAYEKNPDYWRTDPRYPQNKIPYADAVKCIFIPDTSTRVAAMRTGKVDVIDLDWLKTADLQKTNPDLLKAKMPGGSAGVNLIANKAPFTDIKVRKALQMVINRQEIAKSIYGGTVSGNPASLMTQEFKGYAFAYQDWPQELKDAYAYNVGAARKLMNEAGFPNGFETNVVAGTAADLNLLQAFKAYFLDIGVRMEIKTIDEGALLSFKRGGKADQMSYEYSAWTQTPFRATQMFYSKGADAPEFGVNDPAYDALVDKTVTALTSTDAAKACQEVDRYYLEHHWQVEGPEYYYFISYYPYLGGYSGEYIGNWGQQQLLATIWIDKNLKK
jgi:peptide/nickel transport system substrate-binding protein